MIYKTLECELCHKTAKADDVPWDESFRATNGWICRNGWPAVLCDISTMFGDPSDHVPFACPDCARKLSPLLNHAAMAQRFMVAQRYNKLRETGDTSEEDSNHLFCILPAAMALLALDIPDGSSTRIEEDGRAYVLQVPDFS